jgi:hypothetical protein
MLSIQITIALLIYLFFAVCSTIHNESFFYNYDIGISVVHQITTTFSTDNAGHHIAHYSK